MSKPDWISPPICRRCKMAAVPNEKRDGWHCRCGSRVPDVGEAAGARADTQRTGQLPLESYLSSD